MVMSSSPPSLRVNNAIVEIVVVVGNEQIKNKVSGEMNSMVNRKSR